LLSHEQKKAKLVLQKLLELCAAFAATIVSRLNFISGSPAVQP
jgi:hypothetical protein